MTDSLRKLETRLAYFTLAILVVYVPAETYASLPYGLWSPFYLVDVVAMVLLFWGALHSLRSRPRRAPGVLAAGYAWAAANGWRATAIRMHRLSEGEELDFGSAEIWAVGAATGITLICLAVALFVVVRE